MLSSSIKRWYVFYTYPKFERKIHDFLIEESFESFLPMHWVIRQWSDRKKRLKVPMFPNYIFVKIERHQICEILNNPKVISYVKFNNQPAILRQKEIDYIKNIIDSEYHFEVNSNLNVGDSILIIDGPLTGLEGLLIEERGKNRVSIQISAIRQSILIEVPTLCIGPLQVSNNI